MAYLSIEDTFDFMIIFNNLKTKLFIFEVDDIFLML